MLKLRFNLMLRIFNPNGAGGGDSGRTFFKRPFLHVSRHNRLIDMIASLTMVTDGTMPYCQAHTLYFSSLTP